MEDFESDPIIDQMVFSIYFIMLTFADMIPYVGWIVEFFFNPISKLVYLIFLIQGFRVDAILDWIPEVDYYFDEWE